MGGACGAFAYLPAARGTMRRGRHRRRRLRRQRRRRGERRCLAQPVAGSGPQG